MNKPIITDQQISRRSKVPLKILREHPEFIEKFREFMTLQRNGDAASKLGKELLRTAKQTGDRTALKKAAELFATASSAYLDSANLYCSLIFPGKTSPVMAKPYPPHEIAT